MATSTSDRALAAAAEAVGDRWTLQVVEALLGEPHRFGDLQERVPGISTNVLADRLRRLEVDGLVVARPYNSRPPRFVYELTDSGTRLGIVVGALSDWGARRLGREPDPASLRHRGCGGVVEQRLHCAACDSVVDDADTDELRWV